MRIYRLCHDRAVVRSLYVESGEFQLLDSVSASTVPNIEKEGGCESTCAG